MKILRLDSIQWIVLLAGGFYLFSGLALLLTPQWFFDNIGTFVPFNRHYLGDLGAFLLPMGVGLLWAARAPAEHRSLIAVVLAGSLLHSMNHLYDDWLNGLWASAQLLSQTVPLLLFAMLLGWVWRALRARV